MEKLTKELIKEFSAKQKVVLENIKLLKSSYEGFTSDNCGQPPFIIDDGNECLVFIGSDWKVKKLPAFFTLTDEMLNDDYETLLSIFLPGIGDGVGLIRFIPVNQAFPFSKISSKTKKIRPALLQVGDFLLNEFSEELLLEIKKKMVLGLHNHEDVFMSMLQKSSPDGSQIKVSETATSAFWFLFYASTQNATKGLFEKVIEEIEDSDDVDLMTLLEAFGIEVN